MTDFTNVLVDGVERKADALRLEVTRTVNSVGNWSLQLRNTGGKYNGLFDVQDSLLVQVDSHPIIGGRLDGPAVTLRGRDLESIWDEHALLKGVDGNQDLLFHNDFDYDYPNTSQQLKTVMNDVFNTRLAGLTNISYTPPIGATPVVGAVEFREGASFLTQLQEMHKRAAYVFYTDDGLVFRSGAPGFSATGVTLYSSPGVSNIINVVDYQERDGDKHYNYIKLYGKNPMFDGYTENNATNVATTGWTALPGAPNLLNDTTSVLVGAYSQLAYNTNPVTVNLAHVLTCPVFNYTSWDFSKGEIGIWAKYDDTAGVPGTPGAGTCNANEQIECRLVDNAGNEVAYFGESSRLYRGDWGYCTFPIGEGTEVTGVYSADHWCILIGADFNWDNVVKMTFTCPGGAVARYPSHFRIDGISIPLPCKAIIENIPKQTLYRRRPYVDTWSHIRTQNALDNAAQILLPQVDSTAISNIKFVTPGDYRLRYGGQSFDLDIPALGINTEVFYIIQLHHVIEPMVDVSGGFGFDWITEIEACPTSGVTYDMSRLRIGPYSSASQMAMRAGVGVHIK